MNTFFDPKVQQDLLGRLGALEPGSRARWGRMDVAQMLAHCTESMKMPTGELAVKGGLPALFGWLFKKIAYDDHPFRENAPTATELKIAGVREFELEKARFLVEYMKLAKGPAVVTQIRHPFFGRLTPEQWGILLFKHLDHHFRQFGA